MLAFPDEHAPWVFAMAAPDQGLMVHSTPSVILLPVRNNINRGCLTKAKIKRTKFIIRKTIATSCDVTLNNKCINHGNTIGR